MSVFLRIVSAFYLIVVWGVFAGTLKMPIVPSAGALEPILLFLFAVALSIPAVALFAFGQVVGDVRATRNHLAALRRYYEPKNSC
jgi:hypothetical protein